MMMSNAYELEGRTSQKLRTKRALVDAARRLLEEGQVPTVDGVAAAAEISRTTAYRYFPNQSALLLAAYPELTPESLLPAKAPDDPEARLNAVAEQLTRINLENEAALRAMLRASLEPGTEGPPELALRRGRAIAWLEEALAPLEAQLTAAQRTRLAQAIRSAVGIEALVWLTDVAGLDREDAVALQRWSARALLRAAQGEPPPTRSRKRTQSRVK